MSTTYTAAYKTNSNEIINETVKNSYCGEKTITTTYSKDALGRPSIVRVEDGNGGGYAMEYTFYQKQKQELDQFGSGLVGGKPSLPSLVTVDDGTTGYLKNVRTYTLTNGEITANSEVNIAINYDANGNITKYGTNTYVYDKINRLIRENNSDLGKTIVYNYDKHGNITSKLEYAYTTATSLASYTPIKEDTFSYQYSWQDQLKSINNGNDITYDFAGNPLSYKGKTFEWDGNKLLKITKDNIVYNYMYDCFGNPVYKENQTNDSFRSYGYSNGKLTHEHIAEPNCLFNLRYIYNEQGVVGVVAHNYFNKDAKEVLYTFRKNLFGDITEIYQGTNCVAMYKYDAWGNCTVCDSYGVENTAEDFIGNVNPFRYRGYYWDKHAEMYFLQTRWYDPTVCRFISPDSHEYLDPASFGGLNLYAYCLNNPIMYVDPSGHWIETVFDLISLGASVVEVVINPGKLWAWAGLVGDAVDLLPFVTGVGEGIRATKMVKYADDVIDASYDTIKFVKAADMVDDFADGGTMLRRVGNLDDYHTLTKTTHVDGTKLHKLFMDNGMQITRTRLRVDGLNELTNTVFELKPYNIRNARKGVKQILNYNDALGGGYKMVIVLY